MAAFGADLRAGGNEEFEVRLGADHRADVAPVQHGARRPARRAGGEVALYLQQCGADFADSRHFGRGLGGPIAIEVGVVQGAGVQSVGGRNGDCGIRGVAAGANDRQADSTIEPPRIEMGKTEMGGKAPGNRALT